MIPINRTYAPLQALVDELIRCGMRHAVTSPGSRNAPIALTLAGDERLDAVSAIDERAAGFLALGMAKASGRPVAVTCTSGTAAANLHPAVVEAHEARVPLIVLTADRPPELRDVGAGQAIDQIGIYGSAAKWFVEVGNGEPGRAWATHVRALACRAWWTAAGGRPGPVHLNLPLREPLAPIVEPLDAADWAGRADGRPWVALREHPRPPGADDVRALADRIAGEPRGALVCGGGGGEVAEAAARLAATAGWPLLADPTSGARRGEHDRSHVIAHYDVLLRVASFADAQRPGLVLRTGDTPTSKALRGWVAGASQVVVDPHAAWHEPTRTAETILHADAARTLDALATALEARGPAGGGAVVGDAGTRGAETREAEAGDAEAGGAEAGGAEAGDGWLDRWRAADAAVASALASVEQAVEPRACAAVADALPAGASLWVSSSMPIRHVEAFAGTSGTPLRILSNRGANGIDGVVASAAGAARATGSPTCVLIGEVALAHDVGGLLAAARAGIELTVVCLDNGGGGIFDMLPVAEHADRDAYERHVATPTGLDLAALAALAGLDHRRIDGPSDLPAAIAAGPALIELRTDRDGAHAATRAVVDAVAAALR